MYVPLDLPTTVLNTKPTLGMSSDFSNKISGTTEGQQKCLQYQCYGQRYHFSDIQQPGLAGHFPYMFVDIMYITVPVSVRN